MTRKNQRLFSVAIIAALSLVVPMPSQAATRVCTSSENNSIQKQQNQVNNRQNKVNTDQQKYNKAQGTLNTANAKVNDLAAKRDASKKKIIDLTA